MSHATRRPRSLTPEVGREQKNAPPPLSPERRTHSHQSGDHRFDDVEKDVRKDGGDVEATEVGNDTPKRRKNGLAQAVAPVDPGRVWRDWEPRADHSHDYRGFENRKSP